MGYVKKRDIQYDKLCCYEVYMITNSGFNEIIESTDSHLNYLKCPVAVLCLFKGYLKYEVDHPIKKRNKLYTKYTLIYINYTYIIKRNE